MRTKSQYRIEDIFRHCEGAYSDRTIKGYRNDLHHFAKWCSQSGAEWLPATSRIVAEFVEHQTQICAFSTIKRRVEAIKFAHRMSDLPLPTASSDVAIAVRRAAMSKAARPKQSAGLTYELLEKLLAACPNTLAGMRDSALLSVGYDSLARSSEISLLTVPNFDRGSGTLLIPRAKNDCLGEGRLAYLSLRSVALVTEWLSQSSIQSGPIFQGLHTGRPSCAELETSSIRRLVKRAARRASLDPRLVAGLSGHSMRVGAAQDMMIAGLDHVAIMHAGGWTSVDVVARYVENAASKTTHERRWQALGQANL